MSRERRQEKSQAATKKMRSAFPCVPYLLNLTNSRAVRYLVQKRGKKCVCVRACVCMYVYMDCFIILYILTKINIHGVNGKSMTFSAPFGSPRLFTYITIMTM